MLRIAAARAEDGERFHIFGLAEALSEAHGRRLIAHGTLYKALARMLEAVWEDPEPAERERRPRRRLYAITAEGRTALARATAPQGTSPAVRAAGAGA